MATSFEPCPRPRPAGAIIRSRALRGALVQHQDNGLGSGVLTHLLVLAGARKLPSSRATASSSRDTASGVIARLGAKRFLRKSPAHVSSEAPAGIVVTFGTLISPCLTVHWRFHRAPSGHHEATPGHSGQSGILCNGSLHGKEYICARAPLNRNCSEADPIALRRLLVCAAVGQLRTVNTHAGRTALNGNPSVRPLQRHRNGRPRLRSLRLQLLKRIGTHVRQHGRGNLGGSSSPALAAIHTRRAQRDRRRLLNTTTKRNGSRPRAASSTD